MNIKEADTIATDVVVVGGGLAGCAAAIAGAREGAKVILVERGGLLGGLATNGLRCLFQSQLLGNGAAQVLSALSDEMLKRVAGVDSTDHLATSGCGVIFDEQRLKLVLSKMMMENSVTVLSHSFSSDVSVEDGRFRGLSVETKAGRKFISAETVVDATGTAAVAHRAGCSTWSGDPMVSLGFKMGRVDVDRFVDRIAAGRKTDQGVSEEWRNRGYLCSELSLTQDSNGLPDLVVYGLKGRNEVIALRSPTAIGANDPAAYSREQIRQQLESYTILEQLKEVPGFEQATVIHNATMMRVVMSRTIVSSCEDWWTSFPKQDTSVGAGALTINAVPGPCRPQPLGLTTCAPLDIVRPQDMSGLYVVNSKALSRSSASVLDCHDSAVRLGCVGGVGAAAVARGACSEDNWSAYTQGRLAELEGSRVS